MQPNKKIEPPQARNNIALFKKLIDQDKTCVVFEGYKYILKNANTLVPACGLIAKRKDFTPWSEALNAYPNVNMNRYSAYAKALEWLNDHPGDKPPLKKAKGKAKKPTPPPVDPPEDEDE